MKATTNKTTVKATVVLFEKGVKATKALAESAAINAADDTASYKASYQNLKEMFTKEYAAFTTSVKDRDFDKVPQVVYQCFDATVKQMQGMFPDRIKTKQAKPFDLDKYMAEVIAKLTEKGCLKEGAAMIQAALD